MNKLWSARFWTFLMVIATLCYTVIIAVNSMFLASKVDAVIEKVAMFLLGSFTTIATGMYKEYFDRNDRSKSSTEVK